MTRLISLALISSCVIAFSGCAANAGPGQVERPAPAETEQAGPLDGTETLPISLEGSQAMLDDQAVRLVSGEVELTSSTKASVELNRFEVVVGKIALPQANLQGMSLSNMKVRLEHAVSGDVQWSDSGTGFTTLDATLLLDWNLVMKDGDVVPLAQQRLDHVKFDLGFYKEDSRLVADLSGGKEGSLGSWAEVGEMKNLAFDIHATK